jgi:hypothetical protein
MTLTQWLSLILLGGILGALGQAIRVIVGIKKLNDQAAAMEGKALEDLLSNSRLILSMFIGFTAGALAAFFSTDTPIDLSNIKQMQILPFMAAGYAGADFIEGLMSRFIPSTASQNSDTVTLAGRTLEQTVTQQRQGKEPVG